MGKKNGTPVSRPWSRDHESVLEELNVSGDEGLSRSEVSGRRAKYGRNRLRETRGRSALNIFIDQFKSFIIALLAVACVLSFAFGEHVEGFAIAAAILINTAIGFFTELKAVKSMSALRKLSAVNAVVLRDGSTEEIPAHDLVVGDIVVLEGGDVVTADLRLIEANKLQADESALTGESVPVGKGTDAVSEDSKLAERVSMLFKGTAVTRGSGRGVVVAVGMDTELGNISALVGEAEEEQTPLEKRLDQLGNKLIWITLGIAALVSLIGILRAKDVLLMIEAGVALAVAAVPEGLPIVATIALARGMMRMAKRNAVINRLASVETLGTTNVIFSDKTGTLTENRMTVQAIAMSDETIAIKTGDSIDDDAFYRDEEKIDPTENEVLHKSLRVGVLCNNASLKNNKSDDDDNGSEGVGDPLEIALLRAGLSAGIERDDLLDQMPEEREEAFDPDTKMMATFNRADGELFVAVKGAPETVIEICKAVLTDDGESELSDGDRDEWSKRSEEMARDGYRVIAVAYKNEENTEAEPYENLTLMGLVGLVDPARSDVPDAIERCRSAGMRVVMVTGDQKYTALNVAKEVGIADSDDTEVVEGGKLDDFDALSESEIDELARTSIFARVDPEEKLNLISIYQSRNNVVAMTGDGVNDAPALKKADIGIAMGERGTQVAREAADMVLKDDAFPTIVAAVEHGRVIFGNIRNFVLYLLSGNSAEVLAIAAASLIGTPLPLLPLQILYLNFILDSFPALALGVGEGGPNIMEKPPRDTDEPVMTMSGWTFIGGYGLIMAGCVMASLFIALEWLEFDETQAVTVSFMTLAFSRLWHVFNMRPFDAPILKNEITRNRYVWGAIALCIVLIMAAVYLPGISRVLNTTPPGFSGWIVVLVMSLMPLILGQIGKEIRRARA